jgi:sterol desaturase/sphingolipid hydroxylase (fatty acid hydroxylase superfamily)
MSREAKVAQATTNESKIRLIALFVFASTITYIRTSFIAIPVLLVIDFSLRSFDLGKFSPFAVISDWLVKTLNLPVKSVYLPPKRFAARIGLLFSITILSLQLLGVNSIIVSSVLAFFAALESFLSICAGCYVYSFLQQFRKQ